MLWGAGNTLGMAPDRWHGDIQQRDICVAPPRSYFHPQPVASSAVSRVAWGQIWELDPSILLICTQAALACIFREPQPFPAQLVTSPACHVCWGRGDEHPPRLSTLPGGWDEERAHQLCLPGAFLRTFPTGAQLRQQRRGDGAAGTFPH